MSGWYPSRSRFYRPVAETDEIEQGDLFWGVPNLFARHPDIADRFQVPLRPLAEAEELESPALSRVLQGVAVADDPVIVLPHTCDFYGPEKGRRNRARLVARVERLVEGGIQDPRLLRSGDGYNHTFFLPSWGLPSRDSDDRFVNFRFMTTVDAAYLSRRRRLARLSFVALIALRRRLAYFFTDYAPAPSELGTADLVGGLVRTDRDLRQIGLTAPRRATPLPGSPAPAEIHGTAGRTRPQLTAARHRACFDEAPPRMNYELLLSLPFERLHAL